MRLEDAFPPLFRRDDFLALEDLRALDRFRLVTLRRALLRPEVLDRDLFLPLLRLLDFLAAAIGKLRVGGFVERIARFAHNKKVATVGRCNHAQNQLIRIRK